MHQHDGQCYEWLYWHQHILSADDEHEIAHHSVFAIKCTKFSSDYKMRYCREPHNQSASS